MGSIATAGAAAQGQSAIETLATIQSEIGSVLQRMAQVASDYHQLRSTPGLDVDDVAFLDASFNKTLAKAKARFDAVARSGDKGNPTEGDWVDRFVEGLGFRKD